jgi:hypothetical protein
MNTKPKGLLPEQLATQRLLDEQCVGNMQERIEKVLVYGTSHPEFLKESDESQMRLHPLYPIFMAAIRQAMFGKGERHGGARTPFLKQPWAHYVAMHGRGFATGQAAKKLEEAASTRKGEAFETEIYGAMVYLGMAILAERVAFTEEGQRGSSN